MAIKKAGGTTGALQEVGAISKAAYVEIRDSNGNDLSRTQREYLGTSPKAIMVAGKNDDFATFIRTDRKGNIITGNYIPELIEPFE